MITIDKENSAHEGALQPGAHAMKRHIVMTSNQHGSEDGIRVKYYEIGKDYHICHALASVFLSEGWAAPFTPKPEPVRAPVQQQEAPQPVQSAVVDAKRKVR